jgi:hypothetical protein
MYISSVFNIEYKFNIFYFYLFSVDKPQTSDAAIPQMPVDANLAPVNTFLESLDVTPATLLTQDVVVQGDFIDKLKELTSVHTRFAHARDAYLSLKQRDRHVSGISSCLDDVKNYFTAFAQQLRDIANIQLSLASVLQPNGMKSAVEKRDKIWIALTSIISNIKIVQDATRKLEVRVYQMKSAREWDSKRDVQLDCVQSMDLTWVDAMDNLIQGEDCSGPLTVEEVLKCAVNIEETNVVPLSELLMCSGTSVVANTAYLQRQVVNQLLNCLPIMSVRQGKTIVMVNLHELSLDSDGNTFADIINLDETTDQTEKETGATASNTPVYSESYSQSRLGRPLLHKQYPDIVEKTVQFLQLHSFAAQEKRRSSISNASGVTLNDIRTHLLKTVPGLKENGISRATVHRLFHPPNKRHNSAKLYKCLVNARVPAKQNTRRCQNHVSQQYDRAQVNYCMEFTAKFEAETTTFSCDDKNKVNVGESTPAVSRYHNISKFFLTGDSPNYCDHDFPIPNSKIIPSGYMELKKKSGGLKPVARRSRSVSVRRGPGVETTRSRSVSPPRRNSDDDIQDFKTDRHGRLHYNWPRTGPATIVNRATKFHGSSMANHVRDMHPLIVQTQKPIVTLILDNGPDQTTKSQKNLTMLGRLWRDTELDVLNICHYSPGDSALNPIEHQWSPRSRDLVGVFLKARLEGENKPPSEQCGLSKEQVIEKEQVIYDRAVDELTTYWDGKVYDSFLVNSIGVHATDTARNYNDVEKVAELHSAGIRKVTTELRDLHKEHLFFNQHLDRRTHFSSFSKCTLKTCPHCSSKPIKATSAVGHLRRHGGMLSPVPSPWHEGHYATFMEAETLADLGKKAKVDEFCPSKINGGLGRCDHECMYIFMSKADKTRHDMMCHSSRKHRMDEDQDKSPAAIVCHFVTDEGECGLVFPTRYKLSKHRDQSGHKMKRGRRAQ